MLNILSNNNLWYQNEIYLYNLQQKIASFVLLERFIFNPIIILVLFVSGILTSLTPCFISLIPLSIFYINSSKRSYNDKNIFLLGIYTSLFIVITIASIFNYSIINLFRSIPFLSFFILIILSLNLLQIFSFSKYFNLNILNSLNIEFTNKNITLKNYLLGFIIGFTTLPCSSPIIILINFWLHNTDHIIISFIYLMIYLLGCIIPLFILFNIILNNIQLYLMSNIWNTIIPFIACFSLTLSTFYFLDKLFI